MRYYRCRCGKQEAWGSLPPQSCQGCAECGTTLEQHPERHVVPAPHEWVTRYDQDTGEPYERCSRCLTMSSSSWRRT